jgi:hypothetical protein
MNAAKLRKKGDIQTKTGQTITPQRPKSFAIGLLKAHQQYNFQ